MPDQFLDIFDPNGAVPTFGTTPPDRGVYPNDAIVLDIYNFTNDYIESTYRVQNYSYPEEFKVSINVEEELRLLQYYSGKYNVVGRFFRNYLGSGDGDKLTVEEVSSDRFEIRVTPNILLSGSQYPNNNLFDFFQVGFFDKPKEEVLPNLYVFKSTFESIKVFDYVQDPFTFDTPPYSIIFKLSGPLPQTIQVGDSIWIAQEVSQPVRDSVTIIPVAPSSSLFYLAGPNYDAISQTVTNIGTEYQSWNDILGTHQPTVLDLTTALFSGSLVEGVPLNVDFRRFENFVRFGSAEERVKNFYYKLSLIERYDEIINTLTTNYSNIPGWSGNTAVTASVGYLNNLTDARTKRNNLLGTFDSYEKYLYYQSSSYVSNSFGEFYPSTWPKSTSTKPYNNHPTTSSVGLAWYTDAIASASQYDLNNPNSLHKLIPLHVAIDPSNDQFSLFVDMIGHYFDLIYEYINQLPHITKRYESITEGFARDLVFEIARSLGLEPENGSAMQDIWTYMLGTDATGSLRTTYGDSVRDTSREVWKRIITNLPYLLKTKGTARGIRALINCYGIPSTILRVREFGSTEATFNSTSQDVYDQFFWGLLISQSLNNSISVSSPGGQQAFEMRFCIDRRILNNNASYTVGPVAFNPKAGTVTISGQTFTNVPLSGSGIDWWSVMIDSANGAYIGATIGATTYIQRKAAATSVPSSVSVNSNTFSGMVGEVRWWNRSFGTEPQTRQIFEYHLLAPTSYQGRLNSVGSTSSYYDLISRFPLGADSKKYNLGTTTPTSAHPNQSLAGGSITVSGFNTLPTSSYWIPQVQTNYLNWTDGGANRQISDKIRIEQGVQADGNQLFPEVSIITSLQDTLPVDSPRLGVYLSPTDEVNEDISEMFGGYNLDDFTGDPKYYYTDDYPALDALRREYLKKYTRRNQVQHYIRRMQLYDASVFQLVKQFAPERALLHTGLVIESDVLHRTRIGQKKPSSENAHYSSSLDAQIVDFGGDVPVYQGEFSTETDNQAVGQIHNLNGTISGAAVTKPLSGELPQISTTVNNSFIPTAEGEDTSFNSNAILVPINAVTLNENMMVMDTVPSDVLKTPYDALGGTLMSDSLAYGLGNNVVLPLLGIEGDNTYTVSIVYLNNAGAVIQVVNDNNTTPPPL